MKSKIALYSVVITAILFISFAVVFAESAGNSGVMAKQNATANQSINATAVNQTINQTVNKISLMQDIKNIFAKVRGDDISGV